MKGAVPHNLCAFRARSYIMLEVSISYATNSPTDPNYAYGADRKEEQHHSEGLIPLP